VLKETNMRIPKFELQIQEMDKEIHVLTEENEHFTQKLFQTELNLSKANDKINNFENELNQKNFEHKIHQEESLNLKRKNSSLENTIKELLSKTDDNNLSIKQQESRWKIEKIELYKQLKV